MLDTVARPVSVSVVVFVANPVVASVVHGRAIAPRDTTPEIHSSP